jgi:hypothetical protein
MLKLFDFVFSQVKKIDKKVIGLTVTLISLMLTGNLMKRESTEYRIQYSKHLPSPK